jgi:nucleoside-triphosphatase THEP1
MNIFNTTNMTKVNIPDARQKANQLILAGPEQSDTTNSLMKWLKDKKNVFGILTPTVNGKKVFMDAHDHSQFEMEGAENGGQVLVIGRHLYNKKSFDKARQIVREAMHNKGWLVIDNIGAAELEGKGFYQVVKDVLDNQMEGQNVLLVTTEELVGKLMKSFPLKDAVVVNELN